jgi:hypothetical protein
MNYRAWAVEKLNGEAAIVDGSPGGIKSVYKGTPAERPFIVVRLDPVAPDIPTAEQADVTIWIHDEPLGYTRIDNLLTLVRASLEGPVTSEGGVYASWQGDSPDLADDSRGTIVRNSAFRIAGRRVA